MNVRRLRLLRAGVVLSLLVGLNSALPVAAIAGPAAGGGIAAKTQPSPVKPQHTMTLAQRRAEVAHDRASGTRAASVVSTRGSRPTASELRKNVTKVRKTASAHSDARGAAGHAGTAADTSVWGVPDDVVMSGSGGDPRSWSDNEVSPGSFNTGAVVPGETLTLAANIWDSVDDYDSTSHTYLDVTFPNMYDDPEWLARELADAEAAGVAPIEVGTQAFDDAVSSGGNYLWAVGPDGKLHILFEASDKVKHSVLFRGGPVRGAGDVTFTNGRVTRITDKSGHYYPMAELDAPASYLQSGVNAFRNAGIDVPEDAIQPFGW
ncbi:hypothetical protein ABZ858_04445 [Streptomyces sp. NPDC047017]|uniref:hypothetical protein n=1 Tax=Streptomyces sp. NPDC047017 TaxID=3155024 RepID=UPI0033FEA6C2